MAKELTETQEHFLLGTLGGVGFEKVCANLGMTNANGGLILSALRQRGLVVGEPAHKHRRRQIAGNTGAVVWWTFGDPDNLDPRKPVPGRWFVYTTPVPRFERADLKPDTVLAMIAAPWGRVSMLLSNRERLSYVKVEAGIRTLTEPDLATWREHNLGSVDWSDTVRVVTEMLADAIGVEAVLPVAFIQDEEENGGGDDSDSEADAGAGGESG